MNESLPDRAVVVPRGEPTVAVVGPDDGSWVTGRVGMRYRDLLPGRWGGRYIASHIHVPGTGPVPDYVHFHRVRFQLIVVKTGSVEVVYEDQGPPFVLHTGDAVLQPPTIRHRVLHSSADLEVVEVSCPADHVTVADHDLVLPTERQRSDRIFGGQRFARFALGGAVARPWRAEGYRAFDTGFATASGGTVDVRIVEPDGPEGPAIDHRPGHPGEVAAVPGADLSMLVVLDGGVGIELDGTPARSLEAGGAASIPAGVGVRLVEPSADLRLLDVIATV